MSLRKALGMFMRNFSFTHATDSEPGVYQAKQFKQQASL
jgi:hypothetical protein